MKLKSQLIKCRGMELRKKVPIKKQIVIKRIRTKSDTKIK
jgi:hypothetical protein